MLFGDTLNIYEFQINNLNEIFKFKVKRYTGRVNLMGLTSAATLIKSQQFNELCGEC